MSLTKSIESGKEHRTQYGTKNQPYAKLVDKTCRNHGTCTWCLENRTHKDKRLKEEVESKLNEYKGGV